METTKSNAVPPVGLLTANDPNPFSVYNGSGRSRIILTCEHASNRIPENLGTLGLNDSDLHRHIAWDIGAEATARRIAKFIDAPLVIQHFSRLAIDCNRPKDTDESIPVVSDGIRIPGNEDLSMADREARYREIHRPFHRTVEALLDERATATKAPVLIALHTFTPVLAVLEEQQRRRSCDLGLLYNRDNRLAVQFDLTLKNIDHAFKIAHNEPYSVCDETDYTLPVHGENRGIHNLLLEIRNDHLSNHQGIVRCSSFLGNVLRHVEKHL